MYVANMYICKSQIMVEIHQQWSLLEVGRRVYENTYSEIYTFLDDVVLY